GPHERRVGGRRHGPTRRWPGGVAVRAQARHDHTARRRVRRSLLAVALTTLYRGLTLSKPTAGRACRNPTVVELAETPPPVELVETWPARPLVSTSSTSGASKTP